MGEEEEQRKRERKRNEFEKVEIIFFGRGV
jgi:hypothetical protein